MHAKRNAFCVALPMVPQPNLHQPTHKFPDPTHQKEWETAMVSRPTQYTPKKP